MDAGFFAVFPLVEKAVQETCIKNILPVITVKIRIYGERGICIYY